MSPAARCTACISDSVWHHPSLFLKRLSQRMALWPWFRCTCTRTAVTAYNATVWKVDLIRGGRNATSHPYPWPSAAAGAALSDWSVWHGNHFQNPKNRPAKKTGGGPEGGEEAWPLRYPFRLLVLKSPIARSISPNDFKIKTKRFHSNKASTLSSSEQRWWNLKACHVIHWKQSLCSHSLVLIKTCGRKHLQ